MQIYSELQLNHHYNRKKYLLTANPWRQNIQIIPPECIDQYHILHDKFKDTQLKNNTSVYITPLSIYPAFKLKNHSEVNKLGITITRKIKEIDALILDHELITQYYLNTEIKEYLVIPHSFLVANFSEYILDDVQETHYYSIADPSYTNEYYILEKNKVKEFTAKDYKFNALLQLPTIKGAAIDSSRGNKKANESVPLFCSLTNLVDQYDLEIIFDSTINKETNKDLVIDLDTFKTIFNMLASEDESNYPIAKELISNCDFEVSKPYILFLATLFSSLRNKSSNSKNWVTCFTQIYKYREYINKYFSSRNNLEPTDVDHFVKSFIQDYPQYKQMISDCLTVYLNFRFKTDLIKEIVIN
jgi:hypothetical protein